MRYRAFRALACLLAGMALLASPARAGIDRATIAHIEAEVANGHYPGVMIALIEGDEVFYRGFGVSEEGGDVPDAETPFETGSATKTFTATLLAALAAEGTVNLDDPVQMYLPEGVTMPQAGDRPMTLVDIATQRSGLPRLPPDIRPADPLNPYADYSAEDLWASISGLTLDAAPGTRYEYSNFGFGLLGELLARAAGTSYESLLRQKILAPLGMESTGTGAPPPGLATGYGHDGSVMPPWTFGALAGAGAVTSTARDIVAYLKANLDRTGPDSLRAAMATAQEARAAVGGDIRIGLAWMTMPAGSGHWHNGGTFGFHSFIGLDPENQRAVLIWTNIQDMSNRLDGVGMHLLNPDLPLPPPRR